MTKAEKDEQNPHASRITHHASLSVIIAGGGTGGHIYPGIAIAQEFKRRNARTEILFIGTARGLETRIVPREGFKLETLWAPPAVLAVRMPGTGL